MTWKVFINEPIDFSGETHKMLEDAGCDVTIGRSIWEHPGWAYTEDQMIEQCRDVDAVMGASRDRYTRRLMEECPRLKIISKYGIGTEKIDVQAATDLGVIVGHTPVPENPTAVSETTLTMMFYLFKRLRASQIHVRTGKWRDNEVENHIIAGKTIGIIGLGRIGRKVIRRLQNWETRILGYDPYVSQDEVEGLGIMKVELDTLLAESDLISLHVVITPETTKMLGKEQFAKMKQGAFLVNTSRGDAVDEDSLIEALQSGRLGGAVLDVTDPEPPAKDNPLLQMENVLVTPHTAGWNPDTLHAINVAAAENCLRVSRGEKPLFIKNPEVYPKARMKVH